MAEELTRLQASRKAYKSHITILYRKIDDALDTEVDDYTITTLRTTINQLNDKKANIAEPDERIAALITDADKLTETMIEAGELEDSITDKITKVLRFIELQQTPVEIPQSNPINKSTPMSLASADPQLLSSQVPPASIVSTQTPEISSDTPLITSSIDSSNPIPSIVSPASTPTVRTVAMPMISTQLLSSMTPAVHNTVNFYSETLAPRTVISSTSIASHTSVPQLVPTIPEPASLVSQSLNSRLPKLTLPVFSGDPLNWKTFWDSFNAAVHTNSALGCIQKFNYLKAQLQGDAARAIAGLPLTERNYQHSVDLLTERFGQPHKLINVHVQACRYAQP
ncbi:mucin-17-like [Dysidea avara]|uniref:mucin-17-like n=1 Tax=Dysidea avara TaxID=196820 RepID=UPI003325EAE9